MKDGESAAYATQERLEPRLVQLDLALEGSTYSFFTATERSMDEHYPRLSEQLLNPAEGGIEIAWLLNWSSRNWFTHQSSQNTQWKCVL
jgi:hypothetical protein